MKPAACPEAVLDPRPPEPVSDPDRRYHCGRPMGWPRPVGLVFADGSAAHHACDDRAEAERVRCRATNAVPPEALADEAEGEYQE